jgi:enamine deaminase RidA (YjgF/YER057c/UK114 family)
MRSALFYSTFLESPCKNLVHLARGILQTCRKSECSAFWTGGFFLPFPGRAGGYTALMEFLRTSQTFPFSAAVLHTGRVMEAVLVGIPPGQSKPVQGGPAEEMREIFRQYDDLLGQIGLDRTATASVRLYLQNVVRDITEVNLVYREYFGSHPPNRRAYGVDLQTGMLVEAAFTVEIPED